jgi:glycosyltransferase involved in cell wall biosynthesis
MKILYALESVNLAEGFDRVIIEKANYFAEHGYDTIICVTSHALAEPYFPISEKVRVIDLGLDFHQQYGHNLLYRAYIYFTLMHRYKKAMKRLLAAEHPDVVITSLGREIDFIADMQDGSVKIGESHIAKGFARNFHLMEQRGGLYRLIARHWRRKLEQAVRKLDALVLLTRHDADSWAGLTRTEIIPNSMPFFPEQASSCENKRVIFVGRFSEQKGLNYLIKTWEGVYKKHKDWTLHMYGEGEQKAILLDLIEKAGLTDAVVVHEPTRQIMEKYQESSIFLLTSRFEGLPMVLIEAQACGLPIVSFNCPWGPADIIKNGEDGFLVEYLNTDEAAHRVCQLIENDELRKRMGRQARINVQRYRRDKVMKRWTDLFESLRS